MGNGAFLGAVARCEKLQDGFDVFLNTIHLLPLEELRSPCQQIIIECGVHMREFGHNRMEYPLLAILTMEKYAK